jgi:tetratricopeptide (TPR) repeat protein/O-antigen ligase
MRRFITFLLTVLLVVPALIFFTDLTRNPYYFQIVLLNSLTIAIVMLWLVWAIQQKSLVLRRTPADVPLIAFFAIATISWAAIFIANIHEPYLRYGIYSEGLKRWLYTLVNALLPYYCAVYLVDDTNRPRLLKAVFITAWLASAYGILQYFGIEFFWPKVLNPYGGRCVSTFGNPNFLSSYLIMVLPVALVQWFSLKASMKRMAFSVLILTCFMALLSTMTRSSWVGCIVAFVFVIVMLVRFEKEQYKIKRTALALLGAVLIALTIMWPRSDVGGENATFVERLAEAAKATTSSYQSYDQRRLIWSCAWHMVIENPVIGKGWGCFELFYPFYQGRHLFLPAYHSFRTHANNSHDEILEIWSQTGTVGLGIYLWLLVVLFSSALFLIKYLSGEKRLLAIGLAAGSLGMLTDNLLNVSLHFAVPGFLYWWQWGLMMGLGALEITVLPVRSIVKKAIIVVLCVLGTIAIVRYYDCLMGEIHYFKGFKYSKSNDIQRAIPELEKAHALQRFEVNNNYELSNCYARAGMRDKALEFYKESLRANAGYDEIYFNMATVQAQKGDFDQSIVEYTRSLYINPLSLDAYVALGSIFLQNSNVYTKAGIELFTQCIFFYPRNKDILNNLGYLYTKINDHNTAVTYYKKALEIDPDFALARKNIAVSLARLGRRDAALDEIDHLFDIASQAIKARNWAAAQGPCEKLVSLVPGSFAAHLYLANVDFTMGKFTEALTQYTAALALEPDNSSALCNRGLVYYQLKQFAPAKDDFERALALDPKNQTVRQKIDELNQIMTPHY